MRVALLGVKGDFDKAQGKGVQRYMYEMYKRMRSERNVQVDKVETERTFIGNGLSFLAGNLFRNFNDYDIIHSMDQKPLIPFLKGKAVKITTAQDLRAILQNRHNTSSAKDILWIPINMLGMRSVLMSDYIIAGSTQTREELIELGYDRSRVTVINHGIDERYLKNSKTKKKASGRRFKVGYLGSFEMNKNVVFAINAFKKAEGEGMEFEVWGKQTGEYQNLLKAAEDDKRIIFKGFAPEEEIVDIYDSFDVFVFPSKYEGFGIPIIEAQARGLPVIICKDSLIPREVRKYCLEAKDEAEMARIITKLKRDGYDKRHRDMVQTYARAFTWSKTIKETLVLYKKILLNKR